MSVPCSSTDRNLLDRAGAGDHGAFGLLAQPHRAALVQFAAARLGHKLHMAEDVVQEALINAYSAIVAGKRPENMRAWLFTIVRNGAVNVHRAQRPTTPLEDGQVHPMADTVALVEQREWLNWLMGAIAELPERQRQALVGHALEGRSYSELAVRHDTTVPAVKTLIHRARRGLACAPGLQALTPIGAIAQRLARVFARRTLLKPAVKGLFAPVGQALGAATLASTVLLVIPGTLPIGAVSIHTARSAPIANVVRHHGTTPRRPSHGASHRSQPRSGGQRALHACLTGRSLTGGYSPAALRYAIRHLSEQQREYTDCAQRMQNALRHQATRRGR